jgi:hypothetical protein
MHLIVNSSNITGILFYERLGWRKIFSEDGSFSGLMIKSLSVNNT